MPLIRSGGLTVLVDRGLVFEDAVDKLNRTEDFTDAQSSRDVTGVPSPEKFYSKEGELHWVDVDTMAECMLEGK